MANSIPKYEKKRELLGLYLAVHWLVTKQLEANKC